ncbi:MAG: YqgE/AlgH family protein [Chlamydiota bacterium]
MEFNPYSEIEKGSFLVASPEIDSGVFNRAVIIVCEHCSAGSFGLMINKRLDLSLPEGIINVKGLVNQKIAICAGGPLQTNQMMLLHDYSKIPDQTLTLMENVFLGGDLPFLQESAADEAGPAVRLCFGYTGWSSGQLEREFMDGVWYLAKSSYKHIFETPADKVWNAVLQEMGGKYAGYSMIPEDLLLN